MPKLTHMKPFHFPKEIADTMIQGILDGHKTVMRLILKPQPYSTAKVVTDNLLPETVEAGAGRVFCFSDGTATSAPYQTGDTLYVRETFFERKGKYYYKADGKHLALNDTIGGKEFFKWHPSIHMPKEAARIFLRIKDVRVERLQDITDDQALAEGAMGVPCDHPNPFLAGGAVCCVDCMNSGWLEPPTVNFAAIWDSTIKPEYRALYGWTANPWVWVIEFERISREEALKWST